MARYLFVALLLFSHAVEAHDAFNPLSGNISVTGKVVSRNGEVPYATVFIKGTTIGVAADALGEFKIKNLATGSYELLFSAVGYRPVSVALEVHPEGVAELLVEMAYDNIGLEQIVISANRNERRRRDASSVVNSIQPFMFERMQSVTLSEGLNFTPGVRMENNCQNCGFSQVRMNGLEGPYAQILINSRPVFSGLAGVYGLELIPVNMIERVEVIRGGGSAMYGSNAIAGTINLITKDPIYDSFNLASTIGGMGFDRFLSYQSPDYNVRLNGALVTQNNRSGISLYGFGRHRNPYDANGDGFSELSMIENITAGARLFHRIGSRGKFSVDYFRIYEYRRGGSQFNLPLHEADIAESTTHNINSGSIHYDQLIRDADKLSVWLSSVGVDRGSYYGANQDPSAYGQTDDVSLSTGIQYTYNLAQFLMVPAELTSGLEYSFNHLQDVKPPYFDNVIHRFTDHTMVADQKIKTIALFSQLEWNFAPVMVTLGARLDRYEISDILRSDGILSNKVISPRLSLLYHVAENLQLRSAFARGFRAPQIFDEDLHIETSGARQVIHRNDPSLRQETSSSYTLSLNYANESFYSHYQFLVEGFLTRLHNPFANEYGQPDEEGVVVYTRLNAEEGANVVGINFEFNASFLRKLQWQSGLTFQQSRYQEPQEFGEHRFFRTPDWYGYFTLSRRLSETLDLSVTSSFTGPMLVPYFGPRLDTPELGELITTRSFVDTGIKIAYRIKISEKLDFQVNGGVKNLFDSYQKDFDIGIERDPGYMYGPSLPRMVYFGFNFGSF